MNFLRVREASRSTLLVITALVITGLLLVPALPAAAQSSDVAISPLTFELTANPGETVKNILRVFNNGTTQVQVAMEVEDFSPTGERGEVSLSPQDNATFSIARWVSATPQTFSIPPKSSQVVELTIAVPINAEPGGHYGAVLASVGGEIGGTGAAVAQKIGSLLLMQVAGTVQEKLAIKEFVAPSFQEYGPVRLVTRFENTGSVHLKPRGFVTITNMFGREVGKIDLEQKNVLPRSVRIFESSFDGKWRFGKYVATVTAIYGSQNEPLSYTTSFWIVPWKVVLGVGFSALLVIALLYRSRRRIRLALRILLRGDVGRG